jgi:uncharacterized RDD family membrane protein YckC
MDKFWVVRDGQRVGPFDETEILRSYESGALHADDRLVAEDGGVGARVGEVFDQLRRDILTSPDLTLEPLEPLEPSGAAAPSAAAPAAATLELEPKAEARVPRPRSPGPRAADPAYSRGLEYAGFWARFAAFTLDWLIVVVIAAMAAGAAAFLAVTLHEDTRVPSPWSMLAIGLVGWLYFAGLESGGYCATFGKRVLRLQVLEAGQMVRIGFLRATVRWLGRYLSWLPFLLGYVLQVLTRRRQALHDLIAGTVVVETAPVPRALVALLCAVGIVVAVSLAVGAGLGVPAYQDYAVRAKVGRIVASLGPVTRAVQAYAAQHGKRPRTLEEAGVTFRERVADVNSMDLDPQSGEIRVTLGFAPVSGKTFTLRPGEIRDGRVGWRCRAGTLPPQYLPESCRE